MDKTTFTALFDAHWADVYRYAYRRVGEGAADDVAEETFLAAWRRRHELPAEPLPWLYVTARHVVANHHRGAVRSARLFVRAKGDTSAGAPDPAGGVVMRHAIAEALAALSDTDREVLLLVAWEQLSLAEAATVFGCSAATFRVRLHRARRRLRRLLPDSVTASALPPALEGAQ